jgi:hypothetical protein
MVDLIWKRRHGKEMSIKDVPVPSQAEKLHKKLEENFPPTINGSTRLLPGSIKEKWHITR